MKGFTFKMTAMLLLGVINLLAAFFFGDEDSYISANIWFAAVVLATFIADLYVDIKRRNDVE